MVNQQSISSLPIFFNLYEQAIEVMVEQDNIHLFSYYENFDLITDLDNYTDHLHYSADINSFILETMRNGDYELTKGNYKDHCRKIKDFYTSYDYDSIFADN